MIILKCKMCGGELQITEDTSVCECEYCGSKQTIPTVDDEKLMKLYDRANRLRMSNEFDKAAGVYESIIEESDTEAEAYWGLLLCKYGIEYVDDPANGDKVPTCHRSSFNSILDDLDFEKAINNSDSLAKSLYSEQARQIEEIRKGIIEVSGKEDPYDIFICYKESGENGQRTLDSVLAQDVYDALTERGYRVFFSRISLEDKIGTEYEPYIFAALNSAKVMLVFGTSYDHYNAVWVKNEWSRFLQLMVKDKSKYLIPCYKDIDAYDLPKEFTRLQAQDLGKIGAMQDLLRGIDKILTPYGGKNNVTAYVQSGGSGNIEALLRRGNIALEDEEWKAADGFFEEALNQNAECAEAYLGKWMVQQKFSKMEQARQKYVVLEGMSKSAKIEACSEAKDKINESISKYVVKGFFDEGTIRDMYTFEREYTSDVAGYEQHKNQIMKSLEEDRFLGRARQYASGKLHEDIEILISDIEKGLDQCICNAKEKENEDQKSITEKYLLFLSETESKVVDAYNTACQNREQFYLTWKKLKENATTIADYEQAEKQLHTLQGYKDSVELAQECEEKINSLKKEEQIRRDKEAEEQRRIRQQQQKNRRKKLCIICIVVVIVSIPIAFAIRYLSMNNKYSIAMRTYEAGEYEHAIQIYVELANGNFKDSDAKLNDAVHTYGVRLISDGKYADASSIFNYSTDANAVVYLNYCEMMIELKKEIAAGKYVNLALLLAENNISLEKISDLKSVEKNKCIVQLFQLEGNWNGNKGTVTFKDGLMTFDRKDTDLESEFYLYADGEELVPTSEENVDSRDSRDGITFEGDATIHWKKKQFNKQN